MSSRDVPIPTTGAAADGQPPGPEAGLLLLANRIPVIVWTTDEQLRVTSLTGAGLADLELQPADVIGTSLRELLLKLERTDSIVLTAHLRALGGEPLHFVRGFRDREYDVRIEPLLDDRSQLRGCVGVALDITVHTQMARERGMWQAHARHQQRLESIGTLASGVAHEINNPVQSIMNYAQLIARRAGSGDVATYAQEILQEAQRVAAIVKGLLSFARQEGEPYTDLQVREVVESTLSLVTALLRKEGIRLELDLADNLPTIRCHPQQIQQVLLNLIGNAREALNACYPGGHDNKRILLTGRAWRREEVTFVRLTVEDFGVGIPQNALDKIFDPFWTSKTDGHAAGLGLSVSQGIVIEHGGAISVESEPGRYTRMHVDLPASALSVVPPSLDGPHAPRGPRSR